MTTTIHNVDKIDLPLPIDHLSIDSAVATNELQSKFFWPNFVDLALAVPDAAVAFLGPAFNIPNLVYTVAGPVSSVPCCVLTFSVTVVIGSASIVSFSNMTDFLYFQYLELAVFYSMVFRFLISVNILVIAGEFWVPLL